MKTKAFAVFFCFGLIIATLLMLSSCEQGKTPAESTGQDPNLQATVSSLGTSVMLFGAVGNGTDDDTEALKNAMASEKGALYLPAGQYRISSDLTFKVPVTFAAGAILVPDDGVTLTFERAIDAALTRIFANGSKVVLKANGTSYPEWFGGRNVKSVDSTEAIQSAINCFPEGGGQVVFQPGTYRVTDTIVINADQHHMTLSGVSRQTRELSPCIESASRTKPVLHLKGVTGGNPYDGSLEDVTIENLEFTRVSMGEKGSDTILVENTIYTTIRNTGFAHSQNGVRAVNANGLRLYTVHATTGGDIEGEEVRGVYVDGSERGSTGILVDDFIFYAYGSSKSTTIGYKDYAAPNVIGGSIGDRRIKNFECDGSCDYGIYMESSGDFACDISIMELSMDGVDTCGIYLKGPNPYTWQQANITNVYLRLDNSSGKACAISADNFAFVHCTNVHVDNAVGKNDGIVFNKADGSTITSCSFSGGNFTNTIHVTNSSDICITGNTSNKAGALTLKANKNIVVTGNSMSTVALSSVRNTNLVAANNILK